MKIKIFTPYTELLWVLGLFFLGMLVGCTEGEKIPATQGSSAAPTQATKDVYEDEFVKIIHVKPPSSAFNEYWIAEDKYTGARVLTQRYLTYGQSAAALSSCALPSLPQVLEKAKP